MKNIYLIGGHFGKTFVAVPEAGAFLSQESAQKECERRNGAEQEIPKQFQVKWGWKSVEIKD